MKTLGVQLGRFCPYLEASHGLITKAVADKHGADSTLMIVGSANKLEESVPFTAAQRIEIIRASLPEELAQLLQFDRIDDTGSNPDYMQRDLATWSEHIRDLETKHNAEFVFYGGAERDIQYYLEHGFQAEVIVDRDNGPAAGVNATDVRALLKNLVAGVDEDRSTEQLRQFMPLKALALAVHYYRENIDQLGLEVELPAAQQS